LVAGESQPVVNENLPPIARGFMLLPKNRQIGVIVLAALTIALIVALAMWMRHVEYQRLFANLPEKEAGEIVETLKKMEVSYQLDPANGAIEVPADKVHELRLKLASQGFPKESGKGFEILENNPSSFGSSQMMETARFQRALEGEIARSIMTIQGVKSARVHLALPKESVFVRQPKKPSASIMVELQPKTEMDPAQVQAIVHLVASSVPMLTPDQVTVLDQRGRHLTAVEDVDNFKLTAQQFAYKKQVEEHLIERVENLLAPVVGRDGLSTQASVDIDFTETERTQELYNPDLPALRSEQSKEEQNRENAVQGVPGALTNQPPPPGVAPEVAGGGQAGQAGQSAQTAPQPPVIVSKSATRNYELDRTVSHTRLGVGDMRRLTVGVALDDRRVLQPDGTLATQPFSEEDLTRFTNLVKEAVGYDPARGDRVTVANAAFRVEAIPPIPPVYEQPWFWTLLKQIGLGIALLLLVFGVLRPIIRGLTGRDEEERAAREAESQAALQAQTAAGVEGAVEGGEERMALPSAGGEELFMLEAPQSYEKRLEFAKKAIDQDPKRVAQLLKTWMSGNG
jgi:flagellar M-ring protein FliF